MDARIHSYDMRQDELVRAHFATISHFKSVILPQSTARCGHLYGLCLVPFRRRLAFSRKTGIFVSSRLICKRKSAMNVCACAYAKRVLQMRCRGKCRELKASRQKKRIHTNARKNRNGCVAYFLK